MDAIAARIPQPGLEIPPSTLVVWMGESINLILLSPTMASLSICKVSSNDLYITEHPSYE